MAGPVSLLVPDLIRGLNAKTGRARFGCLNDLVRLSETQPETLYPHFDCFVALLDSGNSIHRWNATRILANLAAVDRESKLEPVLDKLLGVIRGAQMIGAAVAIQSAATIALAKPEWADRIANSILQVRRARYQTEECSNVALGHAIAALDRFFASIQRKDGVERLFARNFRTPEAPRGRKPKSSCGKTAGGCSEDRHPPAKRRGRPSNPQRHY